MTLRRLVIALALTLALPSPFDVPPTHAAPVVGPSNAPFWTGMTDASSFARAMEARLAHGRHRLASLLAVDGARTIANTLQPYDDILLELDATVSQAGLIQVVHPDAAVRGVAEEISRTASALVADVALDPRLYKALTALDGASADAETRYYLERTLRNFRLAGVDRDAGTRQRIKALRGELVRIGQEFDRNIRHDVRRVTVHSAADLDGLPGRLHRPPLVRSERRDHPDDEFPRRATGIHVREERRPPPEDVRRLQQPGVSEEHRGS
jgi:thimet oligopeptidase